MPNLKTLAKVLALAIIVSVVPWPPPAQARKEVTMKVSPPTLDYEVVYRRTWDDGEQSETYSVHAEKLTVGGEAAYQSISEYPERVRRITMRAKDLTPIYMVERWQDGKRLIERTYTPGRVRVIRRDLPYPIDETVEVPAGVHDPESFAFLLKGFPFTDQDTVAPISVLVAEPNPIYNKPVVLDINIIPLGEETIVPPAGKFECYVLEMGLAGVLGYVTPENRFWLLKAEPHLIVKAEGGGELVELVRGEASCKEAGHCRLKAEQPPPAK
jgi:hypothetical protein